MGTWRAGCRWHQSILEKQLKSYSRYWPWLFFILIFLGGYGIAYFQRQFQQQDFTQRENYKVPINCRFNSDPCDIKLDGKILSIIVQGKVTPLERFSIQLRGKAAQHVVVNMSMVDMDMGINRFVFKQKEAGLFETLVVLPVCTARRKDWLAEFYVDLVGGEKINIVYPFNTQ